ncbi:MAG: hypothetical protein IK106_02545 [Clostridiales bacterium]|nr:hypothetical protein [Clostridiales bacterium]
MINRLLDKSIIVILSAALVLFGTVPYGSFSLSSDIGTKEVVTILTVFIIALLEEVIRNRIVGMLLVVASGALAAYKPEMSVLIPICIYGMFSDENTEKSYLEFHQAKNPRAFVSEIFAQRISWLKLLLLAGTSGIACRHWSVFLIIAAAILAIRTTYMNTQKTMLTDKFDDVRYDAQKSMQLKKEISQNMDMQVRNATLAERNRIAREIHDNVGHQLTRAVVQLQAISVINKDEKTKPYLESVSSTVNEAMTNIRRSVHELHDDSIDLSIGIHEIASVIKDRFDVTVSTSIESPVPNDIKNAILGIFKEGVTNISKHSNGKKVRLEVVENVTFWRVLVSDDGKSAKVEYSRPSDFAALEGEHGIGLYNINSRAVSVGGRTSIQGGPDGFHITVTIPRKDVPGKEERK